MNISQRFEANGITIFLEWAYRSGASYSVDVDPEVVVNHTGQSSAQLSLSYNLKYNISVTASICGRNSTTFSVLNHSKQNKSIELKTLNIYNIMHIILHTVTCPEPHSASGDSVRVSSYRNPAIEGTVITFSCTDGLTLTGSNASTCNGNGEWEPLLKGISCKGKPIPKKVTV